MSPNFNRARLFAATLAVTLLSLVAASAASADNLLVLDGDPAVVISGNQSFGLVYVDGDLHITGDTSITAGSIYFGPHANIATCDVEGSGPGTGTNACTSGRTLALSSPGPITINGGLNLTAGQGTIRSAGALNVSGGSVAIGGDINTAGSGGGLSGNVTISSAGGLSTGAITTPSGVVALNAAGSIDVGGNITTAGSNATAQLDPSRVQPGGQVAINSAAGDTRIDGNIDAGGRDAPGNAGAGFAGGNAASVAIAGGDVRTGMVDTRGGASVDNGAGASGAITIAARGSLSVFGDLNASGASAPKYLAAPGVSINATAGGALVVGGNVLSTGASGLQAGTAGGAIVLQGGSVDTGLISAAGGDEPGGTPANGGAGGSISVVGTTHVSVSQLDTTGGNGSQGGFAANGGPIAVRSDQGSVAVGRAASTGSGTGVGTGGAGGSVSLSALGNLAIGSGLNSNGANANGNANPGFTGGAAGAVYLRAATGAVTFGGPLTANGGNGAPNSVNNTFGGAGGAGGRIDVVAHAIGSIVSIFNNGGDGGGNDTSQGPGGAGGAIFGWTDAPLFDDQKVISTDGGDGNPAGPAGAKVAEMSPTGVVVDPIGHTLSFTPRSPDAASYEIVRIIGGQIQVVATTTQTTGIPIDAPVCQPAVFTVIALQPSVGWTSDAAAGQGFVKQPSATQTCHAAPKLTASKSALKFSLKALRHVHFKLVLKASTNGIGSATATLSGKVKKGKHTTLKKLLTLKPFLIAKPGSYHLSITLPTAAQKPGTYTVKVVTTAPDLVTHTTTTLTLEITK
jgi:hypothetical protein